jgi:aminoglycoside phosphotransferase (APT) family kinase protein
MTDLELAAFERWLNANLPGPAASIQAEAISGGASNLTYRIRRRGSAYALRLPPKHRNDATANTILREMTLMQALASSDIKHARLVAHCTDESILSVPFMLLDWIDGFTPLAPLPAQFDTAEAKRHLCEETIDALAGIANADWQRLGLAHFGKADGFLERQVTRWRTQFERAPVRRLDRIDALSDWLRKHTPVLQRPALIHGDYTFVNVMISYAPPPRLAAVIDWELATIGDPLLDLGWLLACWEAPGELPSHATYFNWSNMPSRTSLAERYARATGLHVSQLNFYMTLALFKFAAIMEGWYAAYRTGRSTHPTHAAMETAVPHILNRAAMFAGLVGATEHA